MASDAPMPAIHGQHADDPRNGHNSEQTFWQLPFVQNVLPFLTSFIIHAGIVGVGILSLHYARQMLLPLHQEQVLSVQNVSEDNPDTSSLLKGIGNSIRPPEQDKIPIAEATGVSDHPADMSNQFAPDGGGAGAAESDMIASGPNASLGIGTGIGFARGNGDGPGDGSGGGLAPFGPAPSTGSHGAGKFITCPIEGRRIVFCCDATGSMMSHFDDLRVEIKKAVNSLRSAHSFNVVFIQDSRPAPLSAQLLPATPANKKKCADYVDRFTARGTTEPLQALKQVLAMKPQVIYFLIDPSDFPDKPAVLDLLRKANADHAIKIHTIAFIDRDEDDEKFLQQMAKENGGTFNYVSEQDLGKGN